MTHVVRVEFAGPARTQYCAAAGATPAVGDVVVVETEWGVGIGEVSAVLPSAVSDQLKVPVWTIIRKATPTDLSRRATMLQRERDARRFCRERILARGLPMKLTEVRIGLDSSKAMFFFTADGRVDFRELVKDLVQHLHTRVELRQIGVRDEAKVLGSAGACGREFLRIGGAGCLGALGAKAAFARVPAADGRIVTVLGPIVPSAMGSTLSHEHVLVDFAGADKVSRDRYSIDDAYEVALPHLRRAKDRGCRGFVECTPAYLGRDPRLLERLARATGLHILTNTGYYGAANDRYVPRHAYEESASRLAERWTREWLDGIEGTGIRPGFIKTGVDAAPLSVIDRKLVPVSSISRHRWVALP